MINSEQFFPVRYEKSRPFLSKLNALTDHQRSSQIFENDAFQLDVQNVIFEDMVHSEKFLPPELLGDQQSFNLKLARELNYYWFYHSWYKNGRNNFHFSKELLEMFENTDVDQVPLGLIKFPYKCFYISFRELERIYGINTIGNEIGIDGITIVKDIYKPNQIDLFLNSYMNYEKKSKNWMISKYASLSGDWFRINYKSDTDTLLDTGFVPKLLNGNTNQNIEEGTKMFFSQIINLVINALCYISSKTEKSESIWPSDVPKNLVNNLNKAKSKHQKEITSVELKNRGYSSVTLFGQEYKKKALENILERTLETHWRRGHWRNQAYGSKNKEHKLLWIKPTIVNKSEKNPDGGRVYNVDKN